MLRILGHPTRACDGITRRELLAAGTLAMAGLIPASASSSPEAGRTFGKAKSIILIDLFGGPSHIDSFDPKPNAPPEIKGEFGVIPTAIPGVRFTEHVPMLARRLNDFCLIRTLSHGYNSHNPYAVMTGFTGGADRENYYAKPTDHPGMGAVCQYLGVGRRKGLPGYVCLPAYPGYSQGLRRAGPYGGYLGAQYDPMFSTCDPQFGREVEPKDFYNEKLLPLGSPQLPRLTGDLTIDALNQRKSLLEQLDGASRGTVLAKQREQAFDLLLSNKARDSFDIDRESPALRDRFGRDLFGSSALMARRLVEAGCHFVMIHTESKGNGHWDTHSNNFNMLRHWLLPYLDRSVSALLDDLDARGLSDSTLVVVCGDMGRTPKVNTKGAGRDHWPQAGFCLLFGAGIKRGMVHGSTDSQAAFPKDHPVTPGDLCATIYHLLGVDPELTIPDHTGRPTHISHGGGPITRVLTG